MHEFIAEQQKRRRTTNNTSSTVFPFRDQYVKNFCAAKELDRIDQINNMQEEKTNESDFPSSEVNQKSSLDFLLDEQHERQAQFIRQIEGNTAAVNQMDSNEQKQSKWTNFVNPAKDLESLFTISPWRDSTDLSNLLSESTQQWQKSASNRIPFMYNEQSQHKSANLNPLNNYFENLKHATDYAAMGSSNWSSLNRPSQYVNSNNIHQNAYEQPCTQRGLFVPCHIGNDILRDSKHTSAVTNYFPSFASNNFSQPPYSMESDQPMKSFSYNGNM